jgi:hypothetical protein
MMSASEVVIAPAFTARASRPGNSAEVPIIGPIPASSGRSLVAVIAAEVRQSTRP